MKESQKIKHQADLDPQIKQYIGILWLILYFTLDTQDEIEATMIKLVQLKKKQKHLESYEQVLFLTLYSIKCR